MPPSAVYTAGYCGRSVEALRLAAIALGATVLDIRYRANSRSEEWTGEALGERLRGYYRRCSAWGNTNYRDRTKPIVIADFQAGLAQFMALRGPVILLCYCPKYHACHRATIVRMIEPLGFETQQLDWDAFEQQEPGLLSLF